MGGDYFSYFTDAETEAQKGAGTCLNVPHQGNGRASGHTVSGSLSPLATPLSASASKPAGTLQGHRSRAAGQVCKLLG